MSNRSDPVACLIGILRSGELLGPSESGVSNNVLSARHTASYFHHFCLDRGLPGLQYSRNNSLDSCGVKTNPSSHVVDQHVDTLWFSVNNFTHHRSQLLVHRRVLCAFQHDSQQHHARNCRGCHGATNKRKTLITWPQVDVLSLSKSSKQVIESQLRVWVRVFS